MNNKRKCFGIIFLTAFLIACSLIANLAVTPESTLPPQSVTLARTEPATPVPEPSPEPMHSDWLYYQDQKCGFEIRYPPSGVITEEASGLIRIDLPIIPGTNLHEKYLEINCQAKVEPCLSPLSAGYDPGLLETTTQVINGSEFFVQSGSEGAVGNYYDWKSYSVSSNSHCISFDFVLHSVNAQNYTPPIPEFDELTERAIFSEIMSSFSWLNP